MICNTKYSNLRALFLIFSICLFFSSCKKDIYGCIDLNADNYDSDATINDKSCIYTNLTLNFDNLVDGSAIIYGNNNFLFHNVNGTNYSVSKIKYVISDLKLYFQNDEIVQFDEIIFFNSDNNETSSYIFNNLPGLCIGMEFRFGLSAENNIDLLYINEDYNFHDLMDWPNSFGQSTSSVNQLGGYHYMQVDGRYIDDQGQQKGYSLHTGPTNGQDFSILYPKFDFPPSAEITLVMNINNWYDNPIHDIKPSIMDDIQTQTNLFENANNVFSIITQY